MSDLRARNAFNGLQSWLDYRHSSQLRMSTPTIDETGEINTQSAFCYTYVSQCIASDKPINDQVMKVINSSIPHRLVFRKLLDVFCQHHIGAQAAASSSEGVMVRDEKAFTIVINPLEDSNDVTIQLTLNIEEKDFEQTEMRNAVDSISQQMVRNEIKQKQIYCVNDGDIMPLSLQYKSENQYASVISMKDSVFFAITSFDSEIYLR